MNPGVTAEPRRILVIVPRRIGDVLLATPLIRSLKSAWPAARIEALVFAGTQGVLEGNADLEFIHTIAERPPFGEHAALLVRLFRRYDLALSLVPGDRPTLYAWFAGRHRMGLLIDRPGQRWKQHLLDRWVAFDPHNTHTVRNHLALADALGIPQISTVVAAWRDDDAVAVDAVLGNSCAPLVVIHPHPKFRYKMWHHSGWIEVARWLIANGFRVVLTGGPDTNERTYVNSIAVELPAVMNLAGQLSLGSIAALLARAKFYVGPDTAITHMAAASGVPTIALFGPSDPVKWGPWPHGHTPAVNPWRRLGSQRNGNVHLIQGSAACVPCGLEGCERRLDSESDCLLSIPAKTIINCLKSYSYNKSG